MSKVKIVVILFLAIGLLMIFDQSQQGDVTFKDGVINWGKQLFKNTKSITGYAVKEYDWLPNGNRTD